MSIRSSLQKGFTLIEIMVVIAIVGVLTTIVAGNFTTTQLKARDTQRKNDISQLQRALEAYVNDHGSYPPSAAGEISGYPWGSEFSDSNGNVYMIKLPDDPKSPTIQFLYETNVTGGNTKYHIYSYLENDKDENIASYSGKICGIKGCNYGSSSSNSTMNEVLQ